MDIISVALLTVYVVASAIDSVWAEKRDSLRRGSLLPENMSRLLRKIYSRQYRYVKFTLMPLLLAFYMASSFFGWPGSLGLAPHGPEPLIILALVFGWGGDAILELSYKLFPLGVASFLTGHVFYIVHFALQVKWSSLSPWMLFALLPLAAYVIFMLKNILPAPKAKPFRVPLIFYLAALVGLLVAAFQRLGSVNPLSFGLVMAGSVLFVVSDSMLAFHMFGSKGEGGVMETYTLAQLCLVLGALL